MQKCLNRMDSDERSKNVIIPVVPEVNVIVNENGLKSEIDKINWILRLIENDHFDEEQIEKFNMSRLGAEKTGYNRVIKIILTTAKNKNEFLKNAEKLKGAHVPWLKVFL